MLPALQQESATCVQWTSLTQLKGGASPSMSIQQLPQQALPVLAAATCHPVTVCLPVPLLNTIVTTLNTQRDETPAVHTCCATVAAQHNRCVVGADNRPDNADVASKASITDAASDASSSTRQHTCMEEQPWSCKKKCISTEPQQAANRLPEW